MPADPSHNPSVRRASRKLATDDEIDSRRARGEISCAECRRLKLKCDKKLPCSSCIRRGCPSICPNGSLSTGQGTRFVLADTTQLHTRIAEMGQRIRQLEDALAIFQSGVSNETHPLLREEFLSLKFGPEKGEGLDKMPPPSRDSPEPLTNAFGTLTIGDNGEAKYFGPSAGAETLFMAGADLERSYEDNSEPVALNILRQSASFPFGPDGDIEKHLEFFLDHLPEEPRAWSLSETYLEQAAWAFSPVTREELVEQFITPIYRAVKERKNTGTYTPSLVSAHRLAAMYLVFALGALVDLTLSPYNSDAEVYYHLSRGCLSVRFVFDSPELATVQAVLLMANYQGMAGKRYTMDSSWCLASLGSKLAQSVGLHRDSSRWHSDPKIIQRRRALFWEMFSAEHFYSLALGRPPSIRLSYVDCEFPEDEDATVDAEGNTLVGYYRWKYEFTKEIFTLVTELTLGAEAPKYQTVLDLDRKLREKPLPAHLNVFVSPDDDECTPSVYMKRCLLSQYRSVTLLFLHRSFFAQAILDHPANPLQSPYAPSFLAAYRCASGVIKSSLNHYERFPLLCGRWWGVWTHLFSAAIIVGSIVIKSPSSSMASSAFIELGLACDMFEKGASQSRRVRSGHAILNKMREKAFRVYSHFRSGNMPSNGPLSVGKPDYGNDELALFGGQTKVLVVNLLNTWNSYKLCDFSPSSCSSATTPPPVRSPSAESDSRGTPSSDVYKQVHPSLVEYLSLFPPPSASNSPPETKDNVLPFDTPNVPTSMPLISPIPLPPAPSTSRGQHMDVAEQQNAWPNWTTPSLYTPLHPESFDSPSGSSHMATTSYNPTLATLPTQTGPTADHANDLIDFGMVVGGGESGMDEHWMSFMRDTGFLQVGGNGATMPPPHFPSDMNSGRRDPL